MSTLSVFQVLEINLISAQDIAKVCRSMRTYAMAWVHPDRKLSTRVDTNGGTNPTWNDKFVFRVDNNFLQSDTSAVMIEIYALHWFRHVHVGTVRVLVGNLIPPQTQNHIGMRFVALQVRRPSGRPQGILNVGVTVLDSTMRSMPLYTLLSSCAGYQKLMGQDDLRSRDKPGIGPNNKGSTPAQLRRSLSEKSSVMNANRGNNSDFGSIVGAASKKANNNNKNHIYDKPLSIVDGMGSDLGLAVKLKAQKGKADSVISYGSSVRRLTRPPNEKSPSSVGVPPLIRQINNSYNNQGKGGNNVNNQKQHQQSNQSRYYRGYPVAKDFAAGSVWSESEVGPSPSEVAAAIAEDNKYRQYDSGGSSMLEYEKWSADQSEGMATKLERWRMEMPMDAYSQSSDENSSIFGGNRHRRRHTVAGDGSGRNGKFTCFGNICGYECTIVCGRDSPDMIKRKNRGKYVGRAPSLDSMSTYF